MTQTHEARCATPPLQKAPVPNIQRNSPPAFLIALEDDNVPIAPAPRTVASQAVLIPFDLPHELQPITWDSMTIGKLLGSGGFADVYLGQWQGTQVAVKKLRATHLPGDVNAAFNAEARIHAQCDSPRIVRLFGITQEPGHFALVMEYCPQGSLYDVLHQPAIDLPWQKRWEIAIDIGTGLAYLHGIRILHQDLKSLNILLDADLRAKITDFGQSKVKLHTTTITTQTADVAQPKGSVRWSAPETFVRRYKPTELADVYSYGMVLWEIATREIPFADMRNDAAIINLLEKGEREDIPANCPVDFAGAIQNTWREANQRPNMATVLSALEAAKPKI